MPTVHFTPNLARHVSCPTLELQGATVREVLDGAFALNPQLRGYVLDDQSGLRRHMSVFVDGRQVKDRTTLTDAVESGSQVYVVQALSGG